MRLFGTVSLLLYFFIVGSFSIFSNRHPSHFAADVETGKQEFYRRYRATWRHRFLEWGITNTEYAASSILKDVVTSWDLIQIPQRVATGITMLSYAVAYLILLLLTKGSMLQNTYLLALLWILFLLGSFFGSGIGYIIGFLRARREVRRRIAYADLRQRRLSDYRSLLFRLVLGCALLLNAFMLLVLPLLLNLNPHLPANVWLTVASIALIYISGECFLARIAILPRLVVTPDFTTAQHADDLLRTLIIDDIHTRMFFAIGFISLVQWFWLFPWFLSSHLLLAIQILITILLVLYASPTFWRVRDKGRLGGRLTGWPWNPYKREG